MDSISMFKPISKWAHSIYSADNTPEVIRKAFKVAEAEKPGASIIELLEDIAEEEIDLAPMRVVKTRRAAADHKAVAEVVELIGQAKKADHPCGEWRHTKTRRYAISAACT